MNYEKTETENSVNSEMLTLKGSGQGKHFRKLGINTGILLIGQVMGRFVVKFIRTVFMARTLGPLNWGIFGMLSTVPELIQGIGSMGLGASVNYYGLKEKRDQQEVMGSILFFTGIFGVMLIVGGYYLLKIDLLFSDGIDMIRNFSVLILLSIPAFFLKNLLLQFLVTQNKMVYLSIFGLIESSLPLVFFLVLWLILANGLLAAALGWFIATIVTSVISLIMAFLSGGYPPKFRWASIKELFIYGWKGCAAQIIERIQLRSDFLFVSAICGMKELGLYIIATRTMELVHTFTSALVVPYVPIIFGMNKKENDKFTPIVVKYLFWVLVSIAIIMVVAGPVVIKLLFGNEFHEAYPSFLLLLPGMITFAIYPFVKMDLFGRKLMWKVSYLTAIGIAFYLPLNLILIPKLGIEGAAISSSVGYSVSTLCIILLYCRVTGITLKKLFTITPAEMKEIFNKFHELILNSAGKKLFKVEKSGISKNI